MDLELHKEITIRHIQSDINGNCSIPVIADMLQESAEQSAVQLGFGYKDIVTSRQAWVLSRMLINFKKMPRVDDTLTLKTWPKRQEKLFALRDFELCLGDEVIVSAASAWIVINIDTRRPMKPDSIFGDFNASEMRDAIKEVPGKVLVPESFSLSDSRRVRFTDLDINNHMNNSYYFRWILDIFPEDIFRNKIIGSILVNFNNELVFNDDVEIFANDTGNRKWAVWGKKPGQLVFSSEVVWQ